MDEVIMLKADAALRKQRDTKYLDGIVDLHNERVAKEGGYAAPEIALEIK